MDKTVGQAFRSTTSAGSGLAFDSAHAKAVIKNSTKSFGLASTGRLNLADPSAARGTVAEPSGSGQPIYE